MNDQNVVISLTQDEWMECVGAMRILIKETTANSNTNKLIADSVSVINQKIFSQQQNEFNTNVTTNTSVKNVTNLTDKEFDGMLNEIQRENDKNVWFVFVELPKIQIYVCLFLLFLYVVLTAADFFLYLSVANLRLHKIYLCTFFAPKTYFCARIISRTKILSIIFLLYILLLDMNLHFAYILCNCFQSHINI